MDRFNVTLIKQSKKPDPKTGRKQRTRQVLSRNQGMPEFNVTIKRGNEIMTNNNFNQKQKDNNPFNFKVKIHRGDEVIEAVNEEVGPTEADIEFNTKILKASEEEVKDPAASEIKDYKGFTTVLGPIKMDTITDDGVMPEVVEEPEEEIPEEELEETIEEEPIEEPEEEMEIIEEEEPESLGEVVEDIVENVVEDIFGEEKESPSRDSEVFSEGDEEECLQTDEDISGGIRPIEEETVMVNGEMMNAVELDSEEDFEEEDEESYFDDLIPNKYTKNKSSKKGKRKQPREW